MSIDPTKGLSLDQMTNFNKVIVSMGYDSITTNITLVAGYGTILPDPSFSGSYDLAWWNASDYSNPIDDPFVEVVKCIMKVGDTLVVVRSQQQTLSSSKNITGKLYKMVLLPDGGLAVLSYYNIPQIHGVSSHNTTTLDGNIKNQSFTNILKNGDFESWSAGTNVPPDTWTKDARGTVARDATNKKYGSYGIAITSTGTIPSIWGDIYQSLTDYASYKGRTVTLGAWVKTTTANFASLLISDGVGGSSQSSFHSGGGSWEFLTVTRNVSATATKLETWMYVQDVIATAYFDGAILVEGSVCPAFTPRPIYDDGKTLTIDSTNNRVGIGTTSPGAKLDIAGTVRFGTSQNFEWQTDGSGAYLFQVGAGNRLAVLTSNGNIGIGTSNPQFNLHVYGAGPQSISIRNTSAGSASYLGLGNDLGEPRAYILLAGSTYAGYGGANSLNILQVYNAPIALITNNSIRMTITGGGDVGIGTASPGNKLDVVGNISVSGTVDGIDVSTLSDAEHTINKNIANGYAGLDASAKLLLAQLTIHGISAHTGTIGDHAANLTSIGTNTHAQIDTAITNSTNHIAAITGIHGTTGNLVATGSAVSGQYASSKYTTTTTLDWNNGNVQYIVLANGAQTFTFSNPRDGGRYMIILKQPATGAAGTITWPVTVLWAGGTTPTLTTTNGKVDIVTFVYDGTNTKYYGGSSINY